MLAQGHSASWYRRNIIWVDPCSTIIPGTRRTAFQQGVSKKGKSKRWLSKLSKKYTRNLRAAPYADKQKQWGD
eukprot:12073116-Karenia_brevis.AAC.1